MAQATTMQAASEVRFSRFLALVYLVMAFGLAITGFVSNWTLSNEALMQRILFGTWFVWGLFILQLVVVAVLSGAVMRMAPGAALLLFVIYAALTGISISAIFIYYSQSAVSYAFWMAAGMFLFSSVVGLFIRRDLSGAARFLLLLLMGWIFGYFISWFLPPSSGFNQLMNWSGIVLFAALTVWDTQRLKKLSSELEGRHGMGGLVVVGALALYLDFINLFLLLLRTSRR